MQEAQETWVWSLDWEDPLEKKMVTHYRILAWEIPWIEGFGGLQSMGLERVGHNLVTKQAHTQHTYTHIHANIFEYLGARHQGGKMDKRELLHPHKSSSQTWFCHLVPG